MPKHEHPPAFQFYVDDFIADSAVDAMSNEEVGIYVRLLCKAWKEDPVGTIPADERILANWSKATPSTWKKSREGVLRAFVMEDGRYHQKRMKVEWQKLVDYKAAKEKAGKEGAKKRWHNDRSDDGKPIADPLAKNSSSLSSSFSSSKSEALKSESSCEPPKKSRGKFKPRTDYFDLSEFDWPPVLAMAEKIAKRIHPRNLDDRRAWLTFAVLASTSFSEEWLVDSLEAVIQAGESKSGERAHFIGVLKSKAAEQGVDRANFNEIFQRVRIPNEIWNSPILGGPAP